MLVLSRKQGEEIVIGDNVRIMVVAVQGNRVKLGISAQREVPIRRAELGSPADEDTVCRVLEFDAVELSAKLALSTM